VAGVLLPLSHAFHVPIGAAGQMTTVYAGTYAVMSPIVAAVAASVPRKTLMLSGLALFVIANLGTAMAPSFAVAVGARALAGLGASIRSRHENALPMIMTHGWPGSIIEFYKVIGPLVDPTSFGGDARDSGALPCRLLSPA
jgi:MFS family permease